MQHVEVLADLKRVVLRHQNRDDVFRRIDEERRRHGAGPEVLALARGVGGRRRVRDHEAEIAQLETETLIYRESRTRRAKVSVWLFGSPSKKSICRCLGRSEAIRPSRSGIRTKLVWKVGSNLANEATALEGIYRHHPSSTRRHDLL